MSRLPHKRQLKVAFIDQLHELKIRRRQWLGLMIERRTGQIQQPALATDAHRLSATLALNSAE